jgi:GntR family transcriptional regulator, transcriptional repressor for pyruvate dehydrogenase complex
VSTAPRGSVTQRIRAAIPPEPLPAQVARLLLEYLLAGNIAPGSRLPSERQLAEDIGVGRSVVREALKPLGLLGLLEVRQGDGTYLKTVESELLPRVIEWSLLLVGRRTADLAEARLYLEVVTAALAAERRDASDLRALSGALDDMRTAAGNEEFVAADVAFHLAVAQAGKNSVMSGILRNIEALLRAWIGKVIGAAPDRTPSYLEHLPVYEAIASADPAGAGAAMRVHLDAAAGRLRAALDSETPGVIMTTESS